MNIIRISKDNLRLFNDFLEKNPLASVHQTREFGQFQAAIPGREKFWIVGVEDKGKIVAGALLTRRGLPFGKSWLMCPRGPVCDYEDEEVFTAIAEECGKIAAEENSIFLRFETPLVEPVSPKVKRIFKANGFRLAHAHHQPEHSLIVDLSGSEEEILARMKPKGRYNIKVAVKHGVKIEERGKDARDLGRGVALFYDLIRSTVARDGFHGHDLDFYEQMLKKLNARGGRLNGGKEASAPRGRAGDGETGGHAGDGPDDESKARLYLAKYQNEVIAGIIVTFYRDTAIYYYGASGDRHRNVMAPYLLQWHAIAEAKKMGMKKYDLFGIAPENAPNHPWQKLTEFKKKFGGDEVSYFPAQEKVFKPFWYWTIKAVKRVL